MDEAPFPDGNVGGAVRIGDTVRRPTGPWTPAVHSLLTFLDAAGLDGIPRVLGVDDDDREILTYLPGRSISMADESATDEMLIGAARWLRRYHDTVRDFRPNVDAQWRNGTSPLGGAEIICHHDPGLYNWIVDGDWFAGMVDWDMAGPGEPRDDLAFMAWTAVPLASVVPAETAARRVALLADSYGDLDATSIVEHVHTRMENACRRIEAGQRRGDPGMLNLAKIGEPQATWERLASLRARQAEIVSALGKATA